MTARSRQLPLKYAGIYEWFFCGPLTIVFIALLFFRRLTLLHCLILGSLFGVGELFFISKAVYGKKEWLYSDIALFCCNLVLLTLYFKLKYA